MEEVYEIVVEGVVDARWFAAYEGLRIVPSSQGTTILRGAFADQSALHGLLNRIGDLGLRLVAVTSLASADGNETSG
jgi:hypothetical protein